MRRKARNRKRRVHKWIVKRGGELRVRRVWARALFARVYREKLQNLYESNLEQEMWDVPSYPREGISEYGLPFRQNAPSETHWTDPENARKQQEWDAARIRSANFDTLCYPDA